MNLKEKIITIMDFPKKGIPFKDISPLIADNFAEVIDKMDMLLTVIPDYYVGIDSRGFLFAGGLAYQSDSGVIMIRKKGKLPHPKICYEYTTEYSIDKIEMKYAENKNKTAVIVDDVYATGGTMKAAERLCEISGYTVIGKLVLIDLQYLHNPDDSIISLIQYKE